MKDVFKPVWALSFLAAKVRRAGDISYSIFIFKKGRQSSSSGRHRVSWKPAEKEISPMGPCGEEDWASPLAAEAEVFSRCLLLGRASGNKN